MMALRIGILLLALNGMLAYNLSTGMFDYTTETQTFQYTDIQQNLPNTSVYSQSTITTFIFGDFPRMVGIFVQIVGYSTLLLPIMLSKFGLPTVIVTLFTFICWAFYALAVIQFVANRSERLYR